MKNSAIKEMLKIQYRWDHDDFVVEFLETYQGEYLYEVRHLDGTVKKISVRTLDIKEGL